MFSDEEFKHWFLPQDGIIDSYVVINDNKITGKNCYVLLYNKCIIKYIVIFIDSVLLAVLNTIKNVLFYL